MSVSVKDFLGFVVNPPPGDPTRTAGSDLLSSSVALVGSGSSPNLPTINVAPPSGDTTGVTDAQSITRAIAALPNGQGIVQFQNGVYYDNLSRDFHNTRSVTLRGCGGLTAGANPGTTLNYVGTAPIYLNARSSTGFQVADMMVYASNAAFTGNVIDVSHSPVDSSYDSAYWRVTNATVAAALGNSAAVCLYADDAIAGSLAGSLFQSGAYGVVGVAQTGGHYCNGISVHGCTFAGQTVASIGGMGQGWDVSGNTFELQNGQAAINQGPGGTSITGSGCSIEGNWFGDVAGAPSPAIITLGSGYSVRGNYISGSSTSTAIWIPAGNFGCIIQGNAFATHSQAINASPNALDCLFASNFYSGVTTRFNPPTIAVLAAAGTGATASVVAGSSTYGGMVTLNTGTSPTAGALLTLTYPNGLSIPRPVITPWGGAQILSGAYVTNLSSASFQIACFTAPAASTSYSWTYALPLVY